MFLKIQENGFFGEYNNWGGFGKGGEGGLPGGQNAPGGRGSIFF